MKRIFAIIFIVPIFLSCGSTEKENNSTETMDEILTQKAHKSISEYCQHAYRDYQPMEWFSLTGNDKMKDEELRGKYETLIKVRDKLVQDSIQYDSNHPRYVEHNEIRLDFLCALRDYEHTSYCMGHTFSHDGYYGRQIELYYFVLLPPDMNVIARFVEKPKVYSITIIEDYGDINEYGDEGLITLETLEDNIEYSKRFID